MKKYQLKTPTINKTKQKKKDEILYKYFITAIVIFSLYHLFIESHYLGSDCKYNLYVFWIPTLLGFFIALKFNLFQIDWKCCISDLKKAVLALNSSSDKETTAASTALIISCAMRQIFLQAA
mgnify:CR=1 FL=1